MTDIILYGPEGSSYVRSARAVLVEKGVDYTLEQVDFAADAYRDLHPFNKFPALRHGDFTVFETSAIMHYVDEAFDGPPLQPGDAKEHARQEQWITAIVDYMYDPMVRSLIIERLVAPMRGRAPDEARIEAALPTVAYQLGLLDRTLADRPYIAGSTLSLADFLLMPILYYLGFTPEGEAMYKDTPNILTWKKHWAGRPSFTETLPPQARKSAAE